MSGSPGCPAPTCPSSGATCCCGGFDPVRLSPRVAQGYRFSRPGPGLLAHVVSSKYADHLPLYRLEQIFERHGVQITRRTLSEWNGAVADLLEPIVRTMHREQVCQSPWIQCDDTTLDVQDPSRAPEIRTGHLWVYRGELGEVVYDFTWSCNRDGPLKMLAGLPWVSPSGCGARL